MRERMESRETQKCKTEQKDAARSTNGAHARRRSTYDIMAFSKRELINL